MVALRGKIENETYQSGASSCSNNFPGRTWVQACIEGAHPTRSRRKVTKLTWLVLGEDPAARSHRVRQFTAPWCLQRPRICRSLASSGLKSSQSSSFSTLMSFSGCEGERLASHISRALRSRVDLRPSLRNYVLSPMTTKNIHQLSRSRSIVFTLFQHIGEEQKRNALEI